MKRRQGALLLLTLLVLPWLAGCWNKVEIEENAYVLAVGIDQGETGRYSVTMVIAKPDKMAGKEGGGEGKPTVLTTVEAPSLSGALSMLNGFTGRTVTLNHATALFLHEEAARGDSLEILDELLRFRQTRETIFFVITREKAAEFLEGMEPQFGKNPMRFIEQLTYNYQRNAMLPASGQINHFANRLDVAYAQPLTYYAALVDEEEKGAEKTQSPQAEAGFKAGELPRKGGANVEMIGAAAFRRQRMVGVLTGDELRHLLMLQDSFRQALVAFEDPRAPDRFVSVQLSRGRPFRFQADLSGPRPRLSGIISLEAQLLGIQSGVDYSEPEVTGLLEASIARQVGEGVAKLVGKTQQWDTDVIGFGRYLVPLFPTVEAWEAFDWTGKYPNAEFAITVQVTIRRFGLILRPVEPQS